MHNTRFLLPFIQNIDLKVLAYTVQFAKSQQAIVVPLALIPLSEQQWAKGPRLATIERANDFLEAVKYQAARVGVAVESSIIETHDAVRSISMFVQEIQCERMLLFQRGNATVLLPPEVVQRLLEQIPCTICLFQLPSTHNVGPLQRLQQWIFNRIRRALQHDPDNKNTRPLSGKDAQSHCATSYLCKGEEASQTL